MSEENKAKVRVFVDQIINQGDLGDIVEELFHHEYLEGNYPLDEMTGPETVRTWVPYLHYVYPDVHNEIVDICADGDMVACRSLQTGTPRGFLDGRSAGRAAKARVVRRMEMHLLRFRDGKICEHWGPFSRRAPGDDPEFNGPGFKDGGLGAGMEAAHREWAAQREPGGAPGPEEANVTEQQTEIRPTPAEIFAQTAEKLADDPGRVAGMTATYQWDIVGEHGGSWTLDIVEGTPDLRAGTAEDPDVVINMDEDDFIDLSTDVIEGQDAFMTGKLRVEGNMALSIRLAQIME
jgi:predicted ester cyclase